MRKGFFILLSILFANLYLQGQQLNSQNASIKGNNSSIGQSNSASIKIDRAKVWVNGKQVSEKSLPESLRSLDPSIYYEASVIGIEELTFNLNEKVFLLKNGMLTEISNGISNQSSQASMDKAAAENYYSQLKRESPGLFYGLSREGVLLERIRSLLLDYSTANGKQRDKIKTEIRMVLSQLFDINERNKAMEIEELEEMIKVAKEELEYRKSHKSDIIDQSLENLLRE